MSAKTGQSVAALFTTNNPSIGSGQDADSLPTGTLYLNGTANGATVTVTNLAAGLYRASVTMPTLAANTRVSLSVTATVNGVTGKGVIWGDVGETATVSDVKTVADAIAAKTATLPAIPAAVGDAMTLTTGERTSIATAVWAATTRTLSGFGTLAADVWAFATRALTDKAGYSGTATNMVAAAPSLTPVLDAIDAVLLKTNTLGALAVTVTSPVAASGTITLQTGDDYASEDSRAITVAVADPTHAMGLDDVNAVVKLKTTQATWEAASVASTTDGYTVTFEATASQTAAVTRAQHYELEATLANGHVVTLAKGSLVTRADIQAVV